MELLENKIRECGRVLGENILKVDSFLNHRIDVKLLNEMGKEWARLFEGCGVNKILTIEASGIGIACIAAQYFGCDVVFAKKSKSKNVSDDFYTAKVESFTHGNVNDITVSKEHIGKGDRILIIDDFLALGNALKGLIEIVKVSGAELVGAGIAIEKAYQNGGKEIRESGVRVESLARVKKMTADGQIEFC